MEVIQSHPVWVRGLKCFLGLSDPTSILVAPRVGAWIEIIITNAPSLSAQVAPSVGAWIEIIYLIV